MPNPLGDAFVHIKTKLGELDKGLETARDKVSKSMGKIKSVAQVSIGAAVGTVGAIGVAGLKSFADFDSGMREVFTLLPGMSQEAMKEMSDNALALASDMGVLPEKVVPALYQAISAGVPKDNVFEFLTIAQKAAVGGVTDLETAVDGITSVVNAYGSDVISAAEASDLMFTAVKLGKTNFEELSSSLFNVIPTAASLGIEFGDITAALAGMTAQGVPTSVATTQLRQLLVELSKDGTKVSGVFQQISGKTFTDFIASGKNLQDALMLIGGEYGELSDETKVFGSALDDELAAGTDVAIKQMKDLFGSIEATNALLALTDKNALTFGSNLQAMGDSAGATSEAYDTMDGSISRTIEKLQAFGQVALINIGGSLEPIANILLEMAQKILPDLAKGAQEKFGSFADTLMVTLGPAMEIINDSLKRMSVAFGGTGEDVSALNTILYLLERVLDAIVLGVQAVAIVFKLAADAIELVVPPLKRFWDWLQKIDNSLAELNLPDWMKPGSPPPLYYALTDINNALKAMPNLQDTFGLSGLQNNILAGANAGSTGGTITVNFGNVVTQASIDSNRDPIDQTIGLVVDALDRQLRGSL